MNAKKEISLINQYVFATFFAFLAYKAIRRTSARTEELLGDVVDNNDIIEKQF